MQPIHGEVRAFLKQIGLTETEISLYIVGLQCGPLSAAELAKRAGIKRTTTYSALASLEQKGFTGIHTQTGNTYYGMKDPNLIEKGLTEQITILKQQQLDFINLLPLLDSLSVENSVATTVASYRGVAGVKTVLDTALYCASRRWKIIAPERNFLSERNKELGEYFIKIRKQRGIKAQSLWESRFVKGRTFDEVAFEFRNPRILPSALEGRFKNMLIIFDTSVAFISSSKEASAVLIRSSEIHDTMEVFFDGLWENSRPIPKRNLPVQKHRGI
jgi:sugar-specific transcriptional regulator TrmB